MTGFDAAMTRSSAEFGELFSSYAHYVWRTARSLGVPEADLGDVCQEIWLVVYDKLSEFEGRSSLRTWIYGISLRKSLAHCRTLRRRREDLDDVSQPGPLSARAASEPGPESLYDAQAAWGYLATLLERLDESKRAVFVLHELEDIPMSEVASLVRCPVRTAYSRLRAAKSELGEMLRCARAKDFP